MGGSGQREVLPSHLHERTCINNNNEGVNLEVAEARPFLTLGVSRNRCAY